MRKFTPLQDALRRLAPQVSIKTIWNRDRLTDQQVLRELKENGNDFGVWDAEIKVSIIVSGEVHEASEFMGGICERRGNNPEHSNPDVSGYERQMTEDALRKVLVTLRGMEAMGRLAENVRDRDAVILAQLQVAIKHLQSL